MISEIIEIVKESTNSITHNNREVAFFTAIKSEANVLLDNNKVAAQLLIRPIKGSDAYVNAAKITTYTFDLMLFQNSLLTETQQEKRDQRIFDLEAIKEKICANVYLNSKVSDLKTTFTEFSNAFDVNVDGLLVNFTVKLNSNSLC